MARKGLGRGFGRRGWAVEQLESRVLMAVDVFKSGSSLFIRGTDAAEQIAVVQLANNQYAVVGLNGTDLKGNNEIVGSSEVEVFSGISGNIDIDLKGGDDLVAVGNDVEALQGIADYFDSEVDITGGLDIAGMIGDVSDLEDLLADAGAPAEMVVRQSLIVRTGSGNDAVGIVADIRGNIIADLGGGGVNAFGIDLSSVRDHLILRSGNGNDAVLIDRTDIGRSLNVNLQDGTNDLFMLDSTVDETAILVTGKGNDLIDLEESDIGLNLIVRSGGGHDDVRAHENTNVGRVVNIYTGSGNDYVEVDGQIGRSLIVNTDGGSDEVFIHDAQIRDNLIVNTGDGIDSVFIRGEQDDPAPLQVGLNLIVNLGDGNDGFDANGDIVTSAFFDNEAGLFLADIEIGGSLTAILGSGHDYAEAINVIVKRNVVVNAGGGNDVLSIETSAAKLAVLIGGSGNNFLSIDQDTLDNVKKRNISNFDEDA